MTKLASITVCKAVTSESFNQAFDGLNALRKPLKLTATLKRRALKKKTAGKSTGIVS